MQSEPRSTKPVVPSSTLGGRASKQNPGAIRVSWPLTAAEIARFALKIDASAGPDACHLWQGSTDWSGYGLFTVRRMSIPAHRIALMLKLGRALRRTEATRHGDTCVPACCNQRHLKVGSFADNVHDCIAAGRFPSGRRRAESMRAMTGDKVAEIRRRYAAGESARTIAAWAAVSVGTVYGVASGRTHKAKGETASVRVRIPGRTRPRIVLAPIQAAVQP